MSAATLTNLALQSVEKTLPLHPVVSHDPHVHKISSDRWSKLWTVATLVTAVAFIALAAFTVGYAALYLEAQATIITLVVLLALAPSYQVVHYPWNKACAHHEEARIDQTLINIMKNLTPQKISEKLKSLKINPGIEPEKLKSVMARYEYLLALKEEYIKNARSVNLNANSRNNIPLKVNGKTVEISPADYCLEKVDWKKPEDVAIFQTLQYERSCQRLLFEEAALSHLKAAYLLKLMETPFETRELESFGSYRYIGNPYRLIAREDGDSSAMTIFIAANRKGYNDDEILKKSPQKLAKEIFELKTTSLWG